MNSWKEEVNKAELHHKLQMMLSTIDFLRKDILELQKDVNYCQLQLKWSKEVPSVEHQMKEILNQINVQPIEDIINLLCKKRTKLKQQHAALK